MKKEKKKKNKLGFKELCGKVGLGVKSIKEKTIGNKMSKIAGPRVKLRCDGVMVEDKVAAAGDGAAAAATCSV